jgi:hypothetical protein
MSDKLALSAALSVLMMTTYVLFGSETAKAPFDSASLDAPTQVSIRALPSLKVVLAPTGTARILY